MFGIGMGEFVLILIVGLIIFGPKNLPEVGKALGKGLREFRKAQAALSSTLEEAAAEPVKKTAENKTATEKISLDKKFENESAKKTADEKISVEKNSEIEPARITVDDVINTAKQSTIPKELYTGTVTETAENKSETAK